jgi:integrase
MNDIVLNSKKLSRYLGEHQRANHKDRAYTTEEIAKMLEIADKRMKAAVLLMASTGMRMGAVPQLKIRDLQYIEKYQIYQIIVYEGHTTEYTTFCTPEASIAINSYIEYRERSGE